MFDGSTCRLAAWASLMVSLENGRGLPSIAMMMESCLPMCIMEIGSMGGVPERGFSFWLKRCRGTE